jgi:fido (protein-threonine AMPylation protein)
MGKFETYKIIGEPDKAEKARNWGIAIGLQAVDGLTPSKYLIETAIENIEGKITIDEAEIQIKKYYQTDAGKALGIAKEEADKVSVRISKIISDPSFSFVPTMLCTIHDKLFFDIYPDFAGKFRKVNITKAEDILNGKSVQYGDASVIVSALEYDFGEEKKVDYIKLGKRERAIHVANFISGIWQIHPFMEGNTRTTAVFTIKYLRILGFNANNELFEKNSQYFRNALVRANYQNLDLNITYNCDFLHLFFGNLLLGENNLLNSDNLHINAIESSMKSSMKNNVTSIENSDKKEIKSSMKSSEKILVVILKNPNATFQEIANSVGLSVAGVRKNIDKLREFGMVRRVGPDKGGHWEIIRGDKK